MVWDYESYEENPKMKLKQAHVICNGYASNAANSTRQGYISPSMGFEKQITTMYLNTSNKQNAYNNIYTACLAEHGWKGYLRKKYTNKTSKNYTSKNKPQSKGN